VWLISHRAWTSAHQAARAHDWAIEEKMTNTNKNKIQKKLPPINPAQQLLPTKRVLKNLDAVHVHLAAREKKLSASGGTSA
jgi:hypothetical protein